MKHIHGITLDLDDTLWDIRSVIRRAEIQLLRYIEKLYPKVASRYDADGLRQQRNQIYKSRPDINHDVTEVRRYSFAVILEESGYDPIGSYDLIDRFLALRHEFELFPDVIPALETLSRRYSILALSNGNADVNRLTISKFFTGQISAADAGVRKPDSRIFRLGCQVLGVESGAVLHVGDHPREDVIGAMNAGLSAVWVNRTESIWEHRRKPNLEVTSMTDLAELLSQR